MLDLVVNGKPVSVDVPSNTPLLWVLREKLAMTGTKYGCGVGACGACSVLVDDKIVHSCLTDIQEVQGKSITTIEGIPENHPVKQAWLAEEVSQCGYCQPGQIVGAVALLRGNPHPGDEEIDRAMNGHLCRCGTYPRIRRAIHAAAAGKPQGGAR